MSPEESRADQIVAAYAAGEDVASIAARFGTRPGDVERVVAQVTQPPSGWPAPPPGTRFHTPPGWPPAPAGWFPPPGWRPDPSWPAPPAGWQFFVAEPGPAAAGDPIDQLRRLGELRDAGVLTEDEFAAKKAEILSRL